MKIPQVPIAAAKHYADNAWHLGGMGIKPILDGVTLQFATDFANVCIKDSVALCYQYAKQQLLAEIRQVKAEKAAQDAGCPPSKMQGDISTSPKSSIILTD
jgi:hypothetical protein